MINIPFIGKIVSNLFLVVVLLTTTATSFGDRIESVYNEQYSLGSTTLIAAANKSKTTYPTDDNNLEGTLYGEETPESLDSIDDFISPTTQKQLLDPTQIPAKKQPIIDRSNPDNELLEKTGQMFDDSGVLNDE